MYAWRWRNLATTLVRWQENLPLNKGKVSKHRKAAWSAWQLQAAAPPWRDLAVAPFHPCLLLYPNHLALVRHVTDGRLRLVVVVTVIENHQVLIKTLGPFIIWSKCPAKLPVTLVTCVTTRNIVTCYEWYYACYPLANHQLNVNERGYREGDSSNL